MKRTILLLLIVVSLAGLKAQESGGSGFFSGTFYMGGRIGYGIVNFESIIAGENDFAQTTYDNYSVGALGNYKLDGRFGFQLEASFSKYGAKNIMPEYLYSPSSPVLATSGSGSSVDHVDMDIYTIDVPLTVRFSLGGGAFSPYVYAGVNYAFNVKGVTTITRKTTFNDIVKYDESSDDITDRIIYNEFAPVVGAGVTMDLIGYKFFADARYKYGMTNLSNVDNNLGFTNRALWISVGLIFQL